MTGAGGLDRRITLVRAALSQDSGSGEMVETWGDLATVWAGRKDASGSERYRAMEVGAEITTRFTIRWSPAVADLNPRDRVRFEGREYNITAVRDVGRREWREIDAVARADQAAMPEETEET